MGLSFTSGSFTQAGLHWQGWRNYLRLASDPDFWQVLRNTVYFTAATVLPSLVLPLGLAVLLNGQLPWRDGIRAAQDRVRKLQKGAEPLQTYDSTGQIRSIEPVKQVLTHRA